METKTKRRGIWIGGAVAIGAVVYFLRTPRGKKTIRYACECKEKMVGGYKFIKENRDEIFGQIKDTSEQVAHSLKSVKEDIKVITDCASDLKSSAVDLVEVVSDSVESLKNITEQKKYKIDK